VGSRKPVAAELLAVLDVFPPALVAQLGCVVVLAPLPRHLGANLALLN
jgi:hypothetical protein